MIPSVIDVPVELEDLDAETIFDDSYDFDDVKVPNVPISSFEFCERIEKALEAAGIRTVGQLMTYLFQHRTIRNGRFESGIGDLGPNATTMILLSMLMRSVAHYDDVEEVLMQTGCVDPDCTCFDLSPEMQEELNRQKDLFRRNPLVAPAARRPA